MLVRDSRVLGPSWTSKRLTTLPTDWQVALNLLDRVGGWYCDFRNDDETFVVFADRTFRYPRGDNDGRTEAVEYGRSVGVPEAQLDWPV